MDKTAAMSGTRSAILRAFRDLLLERGYDEMRVIDIVERSDVARSTFYEHFQSREAVLRDSLRIPLAALADVVTPRARESLIEPVLQHFWENQQITRAFLGAGISGVVVEVLAEMLEENLGSPHYALPTALIARQIAHAQLGLIVAWINSSDRASAADVARVLFTTTKLLAQP